MTRQFHCGHLTSNYCVGQISGMVMNNINILW